MSSNIEELLFNPPSGNVRGQVIAFMTVSGKRKRVAIATLMVGKDPDITVEAPKKLDAVQIRELSGILTEFAERVVFNAEQVAPTNRPSAPRP